MSAPEQRTNTRILSRENILTLYLPAITLGLGNGIATPAIPVFAKSFDVGFGQASLVFIMHMVGGLVSTVPTGYLIDRVGRRKVVLAGPVLVAVFSFLTAFAQSFPELLVYRFFGGWAQQMWQLSRLAMIADTGGDRQRGRQITGMLGMDSVGRLAGPAVGGLIAVFWDVRVPFIVHAVLSLLSIVPSVRTMRETAPGMVGPAAGRPTPRDERVPLLALMTVPILTFFFAQLLASTTRGALFGGTVNLYPVFAYGLDAAQLGVLVTVCSAVGIPITLTCGAIMDRFGRKFTVVPGFVLLGAALLFMTYTAYAASPVEWFVVAFIAVHMTINITSGNMQVIGSDIAPADARGRFFGVWRLIGEIGQVLSPIVFALLAEGPGYGASFLFLACTAFGSALVLATRIKETLRKEPAVVVATAEASAPGSGR